MGAPARSPRHKVLAGAELAEDLAVVIGADAARAMMARLAGGSLYVPRTAGAAHPLTALLGEDRAQRLCDYYHGVRLDFPISASKRRRALDLKAGGASNRDIARELWITERYVRMILADAAETGTDQLKLFG